MGVGWLIFWLKQTSEPWQQENFCRLSLLSEPSRLTPTSCVSPRPSFPSPVWALTPQPHVHVSLLCPLTAQWHVDLKWLVWTSVTGLWKRQGAMLHSRTADSTGWYKYTTPKDEAEWVAILRWLRVMPGPLPSLIEKSLLKWLFFFPFKLWVKIQHCRRKSQSWMTCFL